MMFTRKSASIGIMLWVLVPLLLILSPSALAQNYSFNLQENRVALFINGDGMVNLVYDMTFANDPGASPIDVVDIGMPNSTYDLSDIRASINGVPLTRISDSPYVTPGIAVELGANAIPPGRSGTLHLEATVRDLIYQDSEDAEYASLEFAPTWFDSQFVHGPTRLEVNFHLPPGVTAEEPRYHDREFTEAYFEDDRVVYSWVMPNARGDTEYVFGASFPQRVLAEGVVQKPPAFNIDFSACCSSPVWWIALFGGGWAFMAFLGTLRRRRRRMEYLPPSLAVEGTGVKRGLTAVEAAILLEAPLDKIMTMILFGLVKKGILTVESEKPLKVSVTEPLPSDVKLWYYERRFLEAVRDDGSVAEGALRDMAIDLIGDVNKKLTGFSRKETKDYYKDIAARAWQQVEAADTPEVLGKRWGEGLEWTMLDDEWQDRTRRVFHDRPVVLPHWWWFYRPWTTRVGPARPPAPRPSTGGTPVTLPTLPGADFANTVVTGVENAANSVVGSVERFTGTITDKTNPPPKSSSSSSRGGGYSCACACACAGCACACAGGGR
jgi:hypothetical protein